MSWPHGSETHLDDAQIISVLAISAPRLFEHASHVRSRLRCVGDARSVTVSICGVDGKIGERDGTGGW